MVQPLSFATLSQKLKHWNKNSANKMYRKHSSVLSFLSTVVFPSVAPSLLRVEPLRSKSKWKKAYWSLVRRIHPSLRPLTSTTLFCQTRPLARHATTNTHVHKKLCKPGEIRPRLHFLHHLHKWREKQYPYAHPSSHRYWDAEAPLHGPCTHNSHLIKQGKCIISRDA